MAGNAQRDAALEAVLALGRRDAEIARTVNALGPFKLVTLLDTILEAIQ